LFANRDNKVGVELARTVVLIVCDRETKTFVFQIANDILRAVEKIGKLFLKISVTWNLIRGCFLTLREDASPLEAFYEPRVKPLGIGKNCHWRCAAAGRAANCV